MTSVHVASILCLFAVAVPRLARAEDDCRKTLTRDSLPRCVLATAADPRSARGALEAAKARVVTAEQVLPSNPVLQLSAAARIGEVGPQAFNFYATLSQEVELGGQRGARLRAASADRDAKEQDVRASEEKAAAAAFEAWFDALASHQQISIAKRAEAAALAVAKAASAAARRGLVSQVEADGAEAGALAVTQARMDAERALVGARAALAAAVGAPAGGSPEAVGELEPLAAPDAWAKKALASSKAVPAADDATRRPEVASLRAEAKAFEHRADLAARMRVPNLTVSVFGQNDGFNERVFGGGISIPIPLPHPLGRASRGEIAENLALARRANADADALANQLVNGSGAALAAYESATKAAELYSDERVSKARASLEALAAEVEAGRISQASALLTGERLHTLLRGAVEAKRRRCVASVALARAVGLSLARPR